MVKYPNPIILKCPKKNQVLGEFVCKLPRNHNGFPHHPPFFDEKPSWRFQICFMFIPKSGKCRSNFDDHILQMGWVGNSTTNFWVIWWKMSQGFVAWKNGAIQNLPLIPRRVWWDKWIFFQAKKGIVVWGGFWTLEKWEDFFWSGILFWGKNSMTM